MKIRDEVLPLSVEPPQTAGTTPDLHQVSLPIYKILGKIPWHLNFRFFSGSGKIQNGEKNSFRTLGWSCRSWLALPGMEFPFPTLGFGVGTKPVLPAQHRAFPFSHLPARMRPGKLGRRLSQRADKIGSKKIEGRSFGKVTLAQGMPGREVLPFHHVGIFFFRFSWMPQLSQLSRDSSTTMGTRCCSRKTAGKLQENQPGVTQKP